MHRVPLWARWVLSAALFGAAGTAFFLISQGGQAGYSYDPAAEAEAERLARIVVSQDQRRQSTAMRGDAPAARQLERAIAGDVRGRIRRRQLTGRLQRVRCGRGQARDGGRVAFSCRAVVDGFAYPFAAVADRRARRLDWCKRNDTGNPSSDIPLDRRCTR